MYNIHDVYLVDFNKGLGGELSGKHYAIIIANNKKDKTLVVVPITSKKKEKNIEMVLHRLLKVPV